MSYEYIKRTMIMHDIHMHIIPGVDDGAWNLDMSMSMIHMAYEQGIRGIVATPHSSAFELSKEAVTENYHILEKMVRQYYPEIALSMGCEVLCRRSGMTAVLQMLKDHIFPSMNGTSYVLTEFLPLIDVEEACFCVLALIKEGWIPVIAHAERYRSLFTEDMAVYKLKELGCMLQLNAYSVFDEEDEGIKKNARILVEKRWGDFLGTDAHRTIHRPPSARQGLRFLYDNYEKNYIDTIAYKNAEKVGFTRTL